MVNFKEEKIRLNINELSKLGSLVRKRGLWFNSIELEYRKQNEMLLVRFVGAKNMKLSKNYVEVVEEQLRIVECNFIAPLIRKYGCNFTLSYKVNSQGRFSFLNTDLTLIVPCRKGHLRSTFGSAFDVIAPFALFMNYIKFRGHQYHPSVVEANITITPEDLLETLQLPHPLISPRTREQWHNITTIVYEEAKMEYSYKVKVPCIEGELYWDQKIDTIQVTLYELEFEEQETPSTAL